MIIHDLKLDMVPNKNRHEIWVNQYDTDFQIRIELFASSGTVTVPEGTTAAIRGTKPDGNGYSADATVSGNIVTVIGAEQMTVVSGKSVYELTLYKDGKEHSSVNFILRVERAALDKDTPTSRSQTRELVSIEDHADEMIAAAEEINERATDSEAYALGTRRGVAVTSDDPTYENNSKYYSENLELFAVRYDHNQGKTDMEKSIARTNIDAASTEDVTTLDTRVTAHDEDIITLQSESTGYVNGHRVDEDWNLQLLHDDEPIGDPIPVGAGGGSGGGGGGSDVVIISDMTFENLSGWLTKSFAEGSPLEASFYWSSEVDGVPTGDGTMRISVNGLNRNPVGVAQGVVTLDVAKYSVGTLNKINITVEDSYGKKATLKLTTIKVNATMRTNFDNRLPHGSDVDFPYVATADAEKTVYFIVDGGEPITETVTTSGTQIVQTFTGLTTGTHSLEAYFVCELDGAQIESNHIVLEFSVLADGSTNPIITFPDGDSGTESAEQFQVWEKRYFVYDPTQVETNFKVYVGEDLVQDITADRYEHTFSYQFRESGSKTVRFVAGFTQRTVQVSVAPSAAAIGAVTENLLLHLDAASRSNGESNPWHWSYGNIEATMTGFNGKTNGWTQVSDGTVLRVNGGARVVIPFLAFQNDVKTTGYTWEIEFATRDVRSYATPIISQYSNSRGIQITASNASLKPSLSAALRGYFREETHHRISFTIEPSTGNNHRVITMYMDGVVAGTRRYEQLDSFAQANPVGITIGSDDCTVDVYNVRMYNACLTDREVLGNRIADMQDVDEMVAVYESANIYDQYGNVDITKTTDRPYFVIIGELPTVKGQKKDVTGYFVYPDGTRSFTINGIAKLDVQGTSSQGYPIKNFKIKLTNGVILPDGTVVSTYSLRPGMIAVDTFCLKADYASSEGYNNVEIAIGAENANPYKTPAQVSNSAYRQCIDGYPILIYHMDNEASATEFEGKYNFNLDKGTAESYGYLYHGDGQCWEVKENRNDVALMKDPDLTGTNAAGKVKWTTAFEGRYPDDCQDITYLQIFVDWVDSCNPDKATDEALLDPVTFGGITYSTDSEAYRLAKFAAQVGDYIETQSGDFYYLYAWLNEMGDSLCKNCMIAFDGSAAPVYTGLKYKVYFQFYDCDTAWGIDNEGDPRFVDLYDMDITTPDPDDPSDYIFKGQDHVLWTLWRLTRLSNVHAMYRTLRTSTTSSPAVLSHARVMQQVEDHLDVWGPAIFNADHVRKYVRPMDEQNYYEGIDKMAHGDKRGMTDFVVYNRYRYADSLILAGDELSDMIQFRAYAKADLQAATYIKKYLNVMYGTTTVNVFSAVPGQLYTLTCPVSDLDNTEVNVYGAGLITKLPNLYLLNVGLFDASKLTKLEELWVGKNGFTNTHLTSLSIGSLKLLKVLGFENTTVLNSIVDASGADGLQEVYGEGSVTPAVMLPKGAPIRILKLGAVKALDLQELTSLQTFSCTSYSGIESLRLENNSAVVDPFFILDQIQAGATVRIIGFTHEAANAQEISDFMDQLDTMKGLDEYGFETAKAQVSGTIHTASLTGAQIAEYNSRYPLITVNADHISATLYYDDHTGTTQHQETVIDGGDGTWNGTIARAADAQYTYTFIGWSTVNNADAVDANALLAVRADRHVYPVYSKVVNSYTVRFNNSDGTQLKSQTVQYGGSATAPADPTHPTDPTNYIFQNWDVDFSFITGNLVVTAVYKYANSDIEDLIASVEAGTVATDYALKDSITLNLGSTFGTVTAEIAGFNKDTLSDDSTAPVTLIFGCQCAGTYRMGPNNSSNASGTGTVCEWSELEQRVASEIVPMLENYFGNNLGTVKKVNKRYNTSGSAVSYNVTCKAFIPSYNEVFGSTDATGEPAYTTYFPDANSRIRKKPGASSGSIWWLRSAISANYFYCVNSYGNGSYIIPGNAYGLVLGFCLKKA